MSKPKTEVFWIMERRDLRDPTPLLFTASRFRRDALKRLNEEWFIGPGALPRREWRKFRPVKWRAVRTTETPARVRS